MGTFFVLVYISEVSVSNGFGPVVRRDIMVGVSGGPRLAYLMLARK